MFKVGRQNIWSLWGLTNAFGALNLGSVMWTYGLITGDLENGM